MLGIDVWQLSYLCQSYKASILGHQGLVYGLSGGLDYRLLVTTAVNAVPVGKSPVRAVEELIARVISRNAVLIRATASSCINICPKTFGASNSFGCLSCNPHFFGSVVSLMDEHGRAQVNLLRLQVARNS